MILHHVSLCYVENKRQFPSLDAVQKIGLNRDVSEGRILLLFQGICDAVAVHLLSGISLYTEIISHNSVSHPDTALIS